MFPVTRAVLTPVARTVATEVTVLVQVPPTAPSLNVIPKPEQTVDAPESAPGAATTVTECVSSAPHPVEYVMTTVPAMPPVTVPLPVPTVAILVLLLLHVPPGEVSLNLIVDVEQTVIAPEMPLGGVSTVTVFVAGAPQPVE